MHPPILKRMLAFILIKNSSYLPSPAFSIFINKNAAETLAFGKIGPFWTTYKPDSSLLEGAEYFQAMLMGYAQSSAAFVDAKVHGVFFHCKCFYNKLFLSSKNNLNFAYSKCIKIDLSYWIWKNYTNRTEAGIEICKCCLK